MNCHLRVDYNEFKNGNEQTRKLLIYQAIFTTFDMIAKKKKIKNLDSTQIQTAFIPKLAQALNIESCKNCLVNKEFSCLFIAIFKFVVVYS
jgi:hypothetical protein